MPKGKWTKIADGMEFCGSSGRLKVTRTSSGGQTYNLSEYTKGIGYVWDGLYDKRRLNRWLSRNGYPKL